VARVGAGAGCSTSAAGGNVDQTCGSQIALLEPPMSQTKGNVTMAQGGMLMVVHQVKIDPQQVHISISETMVEWK
jgi:hypothetical protein